jgi:hypothetical protein
LLGVDSLGLFWRDIEEDGVETAGILLEKVRSVNIGVAMLLCVWMVEALEVESAFWGRFG